MWTSRFLALLLLLPTAAFGAESADLGEIVVSGGGFRQSPADISAFVTVIKPQDYQKQFKTLPEILSRTVGINVQDYGGLGQLSTVSIRGSSAEQVTVLLDGIPLNTAQGGRVDFSSLPLEGIERIEVIRGGGTAKFGAGAIGGVVNIITRKPASKWHAEGSVGYGYFNTIKDHLAATKKWQRAEFGVSHSHLQSDGDFRFTSTAVDLAGGSLGSADTFTRTNNDFVSESFMAKGGYELTENMSVDVLNDFYWTSRGLAGTEAETVQAGATNPPSARERILRDLVSGTLKVEPFWHDAIALTLKPHYLMEDNHFSDPQDFATNTAFDTHNRFGSYGGELGWEFALAPGDVPQVLTLNYAIKRDRFDDSSPLAGAALTGRQRRTTHAVYLEDEISLIEDRIIVALAGRYEDASDFADDIVGKFGAIFKPWNFLNLKANIENSFRYPTFYELFYPDEGFIRGNPNLAKEEAINTDAGFEILAGKRLWLSASYFRNRIANQIQFVPITARTIQSVNTGKILAQGIETSLEINPASFLKLSGNYTWLAAHYETTQNQLAGRPRHKIVGKIEPHWKFLYAYGELEYIHDIPLNQANTVFAKGRSQFDAGLRGEFLKHYWAAVDAKNVTDVQMLDARGFPLPGLSVFFSVGARL